MSAVVPYLFFPGSAREALTFYRTIFGGDLTFATYSDFGRSDGPGDAIAHGELRGVVALYGTDAGADEDAIDVRGLRLALLGAGDAEESERWFTALAEGGRVVDPLQQRAWGDHDGTVIDRFGLTWLIGFPG